MVKFTVEGAWLVCRFVNNGRNYAVSTQLNEYPDTCKKGLIHVVEGYLQRSLGEV